MATHTPVEVDPKEVQRAEDLWAGFIKLSKYVIIISVATLAIMGLVFIDW